MEISRRYRKIILLIVVTTILFSIVMLGQAQFLKIVKMINFGTGKPLRSISWLEYNINYIKDDSVIDFVAMGIIAYSFKMTNITRLITDQTSGYGNNVMVRTTYKKYYLKNIKKYLIYTLIYTFSFSTFILIINFLKYGDINNLNETIMILSEEFTTIKVIGYVYWQTLVMYIVVYSLVLLGIMLGILTRSIVLAISFPYVIQIIPHYIYNNLYGYPKLQNILGQTTLSGHLGNLTSSLGKGNLHARGFTSEETFAMNIELQYGFEIAYVLITVIIFILLSKIIINKKGKDYI